MATIGLAYNIVLSTNTGDFIKEEQQGAYDLMAILFVVIMFTFDAMGF